MLRLEALKLVSVHKVINRNLARKPSAIIANFRLQFYCEYRSMPLMQWLSDDALKELGGLTGIATMLHAPVTTVNSWRHIGIPKSRLEHLKLAAQADGKEIDWDAALVAIAPKKAAA